MKQLTFVLLLLMLGCSDVSLVEHWKNPDIVLFDAQKVLIVGMTNDKAARIKFENGLKKEFDKRNIEAMRSLDVFDINFTDSKKTEKELDAFEESLLDKDFDAILLTKIVGVETRQTLKKSVNNLSNLSDRFNEDYRRNQGIYYEEDYYENFNVYNAETSLYCICFGKERSLIWRGSIDIMDPKNIDKTIDDYVELVVLAMEEQDLIFRKDKNDEVTGI